MRAENAIVKDIEEAIGLRPGPERTTLLRRALQMLEATDRVVDGAVLRSLALSYMAQDGSVDVQAAQAAFVEAGNPAWASSQFSEALWSNGRMEDLVALSHEGYDRELQGDMLWRAVRLRELVAAAAMLTGDLARAAAFSSKVFESMRDAPVDEFLAPPADLLRALLTVLSDRAAGQPARVLARQLLDEWQRSMPLSDWFTAQEVKQVRQALEDSE